MQASFGTAHPAGVEARLDPGGARPPILPSDVPEALRGSASGESRVAGVWGAERSRVGAVQMM